MDVPGGLICLGGLAVLGHRAAHRVLAAPEALVLAEADSDAVDGTRLLLDYVAKIQAVVVPVVKVAFRVQGNIGLINQAAAPAEVVPAAQLVLLKEHKDVLFVYLDYPYLYGAKVHGLEGKNQVTLVREDVAADGNLNCGFLAVLLEHLLEFLFQGGAGCVFHVLVHGQDHVTLAALEVHLNQAVFHLNVAARHALEVHHTFLGGIHGCLAKDDVNAAVLQRCLPHTEPGAGVNLFHRLGSGLSHGEAKVEGTRHLRSRHSRLRSGISDHLAQGKTGPVGLPRLQSLRPEGHDALALPLGCTLDGGLEREHIGRALRGVLCQFHANHRIRAYDTARVCLHVLGINLRLRRLSRLLGPARPKHGHCS